MVIGEYFLSLLLQLLFTVGAVALFGFAIYLADRAFYRLAGGGRAVCYITGAIGTPIHEASHALMCLVFGHRIEEIKLFAPDPETGTLGYVRHSYDRHNLWHRIGNFFIGVAPVVIGSGVILLLLVLLVPQSREGVTGALSVITNASGVPAKAGAAFVAAGRLFVSVFSPACFTNGLWYLFIVVALCISLHVDLSPADVKGSVSGAVVLVLALAAVDAVLAVAGAVTGADPLGAVTSGIVTGGAVMSGVMALSLALSLVLVVIAAVVRLIVSAVSRT